MKKSITIMTALMLSFGLLMGCANGSSDDSTTDNTNKKNEQTDNSETLKPTTPTPLLPSVTKTLFGGELPESVGGDPLNGKTISSDEDEGFVFNNGEMSYHHYNTTSSIFKYSWNTEKKEIYLTPYKLSHKEHSGNDTLYDNVEDYMTSYPSGTPWSSYKNELKEYYKLLSKGVSTWSYKMQGEDISLFPIFDGELLNCNVTALGDFNNDDISFSYISFDDTKPLILLNIEGIRISSSVRGQGILIAKEGNNFTYLIRQNNSSFKDGTITFQFELNSGWTAIEASITATVISADQTVLSNYKLAINDSFILTF